MNSLVFLLAQGPAPESFFDGFTVDQRFGLVVMVIICVVLLAVMLIVAFASVWSAIKTKQIEVDLKHDMLDRGMTAEEIQQVFEAAPRSGFDRWLSTWCNNKN